MHKVEEMRKFKELLDAGVITEEDFEKKKNEILSDNGWQEVSEAETERKSGKLLKILRNKTLLKKILIGAGILAVVLIIFSIGKKVVENNQREKRAAALEEAIASIMDDYGLNNYTVKAVDYRYDVFAEGFEQLTKGEALSCLKELDFVRIDDPCGDGKIDFGMTFVHPGLEVEYSYWRVSSYLVQLNEMAGGGGYEKPGIYCNRSGNTCVYECEN